MVNSFKINKTNVWIKMTKGCITKIEYKYGLKEMFSINCVKCGKKKTLKEFFCVPLGLCEECDIKECKEFLK